MPLLLDHVNDGDSVINYILSTNLWIINYHIDNTTCVQVPEKLYTWLLTLIGGGRGGYWCLSKDDTGELP